MEKLCINDNLFENIKKISEDGVEYWSARELQKVLTYKEWRKFNNVIEKAKTACKASGYDSSKQFVSVDKPISGGNGNIQNVKDYLLSRYACYLIAQNGDSRKKVIALAQTYFAVQTRKQELSEDIERLEIRKKVKRENLMLNKIAISSGVKRLDEFHNAGYKGLYNGETANDIFKRKELRYRQDILDNMGSEELGANLFRITQTEAKLKRDNVDNEYEANSVHYQIGKKVRKAIKDMGGSMPETLPKPNKSIKEIENNLKNNSVK